jgi:hypothetical protein
VCGVPPPPPPVCDIKVSAQVTYRTQRMEEKITPIYIQTDCTSKYGPSFSCPCIRYIFYNFHHIIGPEKHSYEDRFPFGQVSIIDSFQNLKKGAVTSSVVG